MVKFLIIGDLHGDKPNIYVDKRNFDAIIFPGDVCSDKRLRKEQDKWIKSWATSKTPFKDWEKYLEIFGKKNYERLEKLELEDGRKLLRYLCSFGKPVFFIPGNWDQSWGDTSINEEDRDDPYLRRKSALEMMYGKTNKKLIKGLRNFNDCQFKLKKFMGINIFGYGVTNFPEGVNKKRKILEGTKSLTKKQKKELQELYDGLLYKLQTLWNKRNKKFPTIYLSHNMPHGIMDKILKEGSPVYGEHYGSTVSLDFIRKNQPLLCIGAHMHEYLGKKKIGRTTVINAGFGPKVNTLLDIDEKNGKIRSINFIKKDKRRDVNRKIGWK